MLSKNQSGVLAASYYYDGSVAPGAPSSLLGIVPSDIGKLSFTRTYLSQTYGLTGAQPYDDQYFGYDPLGRLKHWTDGPPSEWGYAAHSIDAIYDLAGNMTGLTYPDGQSITQTIDGAGRLSGVFAGTSNSGPAYVSSIAYLPDGSPNVVSYGNGVTETLTQNNRRQPCESMVAGNGLTLIHRQYFYGSSNAPGQQCNPASANNGNIQSIGDAINAPHSQAFSYDALNRIQSWDTSSFAGALRHQSFNYDSFGNINQTNGYPPAVGTPDPLTFPSAYNASAWPYDANNHLLPSVFGCLPLGVSGMPGQVSGYDVAGNTLCSGQYGGSAQAFVWDPESRLSQLWGEQNNNNYSLEAVYSYDAQGNRIRSDQMMPGSGSGTYVTSAFREYSFFGGQMLAEKDQTGAWTDYVYANGKKIAIVPNVETRIHFHGNNTAGTFNAMGLPVNRLIQTNDKLAWRQYNAGSNVDAGIYLGFTDGTTTLQSVSDNHGQWAESGGPNGAWGWRIVDLSQFAGKTINGSALMSGFGSLGRWDVWYADIAIYGADGTVAQIFDNQTIPMGSLYISTPSNQTEGQICLERGSSCVMATTAQPAAAGTYVTHYYLADHLGTTQMEFASGGWPVWKGEFAPFGQELDTQTTLNRYKFTGKERDSESGLDNFGARYFGSNMGRFMSPDFTGVGSDPVPVPSADFENPQSLNLYSYVHNNPLTNVDPDGHDCVVQTRTSDTTESVSVSSGNCDNVKTGDGQTATYVAGTVTSVSAGAGGHSIDVGYTPYSGGGDAGVANLNAAPTPDRPGLAYNYGNNAQGYQQLGAASQFVKDATVGYAVAFGSVGAVIAGGEIAAGTAAARSQIIFRLAHGMRIAADHSQVLADVGAVKNAIAAAVASGAVTSLGGSAFQGVVNVAGTYIRFTGANTPGGTIISNVMGAALQK